MADGGTPHEIDPAAKDLIALKHWADSLSRSAANYRPADAVSALEELQRRAGAAVAKIGTDVPDDVRLWAKGIERDAGKALDAAKALDESGRGPQDEQTLNELTKRLGQISSNADYAANGIQSMPPTPETTSPGVDVVDVVDVVDLTRDAAPSSPPVVHPSVAPSAPPETGESPADEPMVDNPLWPMDAFGEIERAASDPDYGIPPNLRRPWSAEPEDLAEHWKQSWEAGPETAPPMGNVPSPAPTPPSSAAPGPTTSSPEHNPTLEDLDELVKVLDPEAIALEDFSDPPMPSTSHTGAETTHHITAPAAGIEAMEQSVVPTVLPEPDMDALVAEAPYEDPGIWNPDLALEPEIPYDPPGEEFV